MLVLSRRSGEQIVLPDLGIVITMVAVTGGRARVGIMAPADVRVLRAEIVPPPAGAGSHPQGDREPRSHTHGAE